MYNLSKKELQKVIEGIFEFDALTESEKEAFDWLDHEVNNQATKSELIYSLIETMISWYFYQHKFERLQEYELCALIRDVIKVEIKECNRMLNTYFILEEGDCDLIEELKQKAKDRVIANFDEWKKIIDQE